MSYNDIAILIDYRYDYDIKLYPSEAIHQRNKVCCIAVIAV